MEAFGLLLYGFKVLLTWKILAFMLVGLSLGIFVGVLPGLGGPNGVAILLPLTFTMDPTTAIVMLSCIYWGALFGGAITSILFNIPGEAWSVATTFDGYPMAQKGQAAEALTAAFTSSFIGSLVAVLLITFLAPRIADFALKFGPPEFFAVYLLTFCSFVGLGREAKHKTIISMALGLLLAGIGMDTVSGQLRMTFGSSELMRGVNFLVAVIGLFGISEILLTMEERLALRGHAAKISLKVVLSVWKDLPKYWWTLFRSSVIGCWLGITPGGAIAASFMGYNVAKRMSRNPETFGTGRIEGVFAPETAAHASGTSALLPMLSLGIPGSGTAAILLGGLMVWGLNPGPLLFVEHKSFVWGLIASMYLGNIVGLVMVLSTVPLFAAVLRVPFAAIAPMIVVSCAIGAYAIQNAMFDMYLMLVFGVLGYVLKKIRVPVAPLTLALVLGSKAEDAFRLSMIGSEGDLRVFFSNGLVGTITTLAIVLLLWPLISKAIGASRRQMRRMMQKTVEPRA
jgi:TctA family transporter